MREMIAGRILKDLKDQEGNETGEQKSVAEIMADVIFEAMEGRLILSSGKHGVTYVNPLHAVKLFQDYMLKARELSIRVRALKKEKGASGGIRIVLPSVPADPLLKPGQPRRPLRILGQDPSKPLPPGLRPINQPSPCGPDPDAFDAAELIEDFEHPICHICMGTRMVRDENGINMVTCPYCDGAGRAPAPA